jgi:anti-sigma factor RsiW
MINCHTIDAFVTPFVDGELPDEDRRAIDAHLRACAPCYSRVAAERAVHELIRARQSSLNAERAPAPLRATCAGLASAFAPAGVARATADRQRAADNPRDAADMQPRPFSWRARVTPYALAASLVIVVGGAFVYQATEHSAHFLAAQLTADHMRCFAMNSALGTHQATSVVEGAMISSFGWNVHLPQNAARAGLELVGARPCLYGEGRVAHIMYRHGGRPVSLFMLPKTARTQQLLDVLGHEAAIWCVGNRTFVLIARESRQQVEQLATFVRAELH